MFINTYLKLSKMKKVFKKGEVAHIWANRIQEEGRNSGGNFYFDHDTIYSYGRHFAIAKHVIGVNGERAVLFTQRRYSKTTAKQINVTRHAVQHLDVIYCNDPSEGTTLNIESFIKSIKAELLGLDKAKKPEKYIEPAKREYDMLVTYCNFFGVKVPKEAKKIIEQVDNGKYAQYLKKESARLKALAIQREAERKASNLLMLNEWRSFERTESIGAIDQLSFLRFNIQAKRVETSQGVEIPETIAKRAFNWIITTIATGGCDGQCNYKILDYVVKSVTPELITIGCHKIELSEIEKLAKKLGW